MIKHSHNDYWCDKPIKTAMLNGCRIIEADVIFKDNDLYLSHSWRPFKCLTYGTLEDVYLKPMSKIAEYLYLYIEFKTSNQKAAEKLKSLLTQYHNPYIKILVFAKDRTPFTFREKVMKQFLGIYPAEYIRDFGKEIKRLDLYEPSLNHF